MLSRAPRPIPAPHSRALWWDPMRPHLDHHLHSLRAFSQAQSGCRSRKVRCPGCPGKKDSRRSLPEEGRERDGHSSPPGRQEDDGKATSSETLGDIWWRLFLGVKPPREAEKCHCCRQGDGPALSGTTSPLSLCVQPHYFSNSTILPPAHEALPSLC